MERAREANIWPLAYTTHTYTEAMGQVHSHTYIQHTCSILSSICPMLPTSLKPCLHRSTAWLHKKSVYKLSPAFLRKKPAGSELFTNFLSLLAPPVPTHTEGGDTKEDLGGIAHQGDYTQHLLLNQDFLSSKHFCWGRGAVDERRSLCLPKSPKQFIICSPDLSHKRSSLEPWLPKHTWAHLGSPEEYFINPLSSSHGLLRS